MTASRASEPTPTTPRANPSPRNARVVASLWSLRLFISPVVDRMRFEAPAISELKRSVFAVSCRKMLPIDAMRGITAGYVIGSELPDEIALFLLWGGGRLGDEVLFGKWVRPFLCVAVNVVNRRADPGEASILAFLLGAEVGREGRKLRRGEIPKLRLAQPDREPPERPVFRLLFFSESSLSVPRLTARFTASAYSGAWSRSRTSTRSSGVP